MERLMAKKADLENRLKKRRKNNLLRGDANLQF